MRPVERIDNFLKLVDKEKLALRWFGESEDNDFYLNIPKQAIKYWKENPDQRIGQVLINLNLIPDNFNIWIDDETNILLDQGIEPRECIYWTSIYDKYENVLSQPKTQLLKDMDTSHLYAILEFANKRMLHLPLKQIIQDEIKYREQKKGTH